jgi:catechol 2,3-dioxygenase-like lactoylglutathione lyase family enzyme
MLGHHDAVATVAVADLARARAFYEGPLGLEPVESRPGTALYRAGSTTLLVYVSRYAGGKGATAVTWMIGSGIEALVEGLAAAGVPFEHYDMPDTTHAGHLHLGHGMKIAWFKDPDGNIHALAEG